MRLPVAKQTESTSSLSENKQGAALMRIRYMSDLHLELTGYQPQIIPPVDEDVVVLAGDIGAGLAGIHWASHAFGDRPVIYVLGNHEYYQNHFDELPHQARAAAARSNVHVLEDEAIVIGGVRFLGATFWTDFKLFGAYRQSQCMQAASDITDYREIHTGPLGMIRTVAPEETAARNKVSRTWLNREISQSQEPCVVITHHGPSYITCAAERRGDPLTAAFINNANDLIRPPIQAWIFGHTHQALKSEINGIPLLTNQRGYPGEEILDFRWDTCFEISAML